MKFLFLAAFLLVTFFLIAGVLKNPKRTKLSARSPYRSTSVVSGAGACCAVKSIDGKYFLDVDKVRPGLPLTDCNASKCSCKYVHHEDRRDNDEDRRYPRSLQTELYDRTDKSERRNSKRGRRKTDHVLTTYRGQIRGPDLLWHNSVPD